MNAINYFHSASNVWLITKTIIFMLLAGFNAYSYSQDTATRIRKHEETYSQLMQEIGLSSSRNLTSTNNNLNNLKSKQAFPSKELLAATDDLLTIAQDLNNLYVLCDDIISDLRALKTSTYLASMVTEAKYVPIAKQFLELDRSSLLKAIPSKIEKIDKTLRFAKDQETIRLMLKARDTFKSSIDFLNQLPISDLK